MPFAPLGAHRVRSLSWRFRSPILIEVQRNPKQARGRGGVRAGMNAEFRHDRADMMVDRFSGEVKVVRDFRIAPARGEQRQNLKFPRGEIGGIGARRGPGSSRNARYAE